MTVLFHGPPTRGPVVHFCEKEKGGDTDLGQPVLFLLNSRVLPLQASRLECCVQNGLCNCLRHNMCFVQSVQKSSQRMCAGGAYPQPIRRMFPRACTQRHMARIRGPCELDQGSRTRLLCQNGNVSWTQRRTDTPNPVYNTRQPDKNYIFITV